MGGEDGPANGAVGGHGCQFPPTHNHNQNADAYVAERHPESVLVLLMDAHGERSPT